MAEERIKKQYRNDQVSDGLSLNVPVGKLRPNSFRNVASMNINLLETNEPKIVNIQEPVSEN